MKNSPQLDKPLRTPGQAAYEADCQRKPRYHDGRLRETWEQLGALERQTWERNPTPRNYS